MECHGQLRRFIGDEAAHACATTTISLVGSLHMAKYKPTPRNRNPRPLWEHETALNGYVHEDTQGILTLGVDVACTTPPGRTRCLGAEGADYPAMWGRH